LLVGSSPSSPNVLIAHGGQATKGGKRMMFGKVGNLVLAGVEPFFIDVSSVSPNNFSVKHGETIPKKTLAGETHRAES